MRQSNHILRCAPLALALSWTAAVGVHAASPPGGTSPEASVRHGSLLPTACPAGTALQGGDIATIAGTGSYGASGDGGRALAATISPSYGMAAFDPSGALVFADGQAIRRIGTDGIITTVAGPATGAPFVQPTGLAIDTAGEMYVADFGASRIYRMDPTGTITAVAGNGTGGSAGNGGPALDAEIGLAQVAIGPGGDLFFDDSNAYRTVDPTGTIDAYAGTGTAGFSGDGGPAVTATLGAEVLGVAVDADGNVYLGDQGNHRIRKVDDSGIITTLAGTGLSGDTGDGGPATAATLEAPRSIATDDAGNVYVADWGTNTVRRIDTTGTITTVAGTGHPGFSGDCGPAASAQLDQPYGLAVRDGVLFIGDEGNHRIRMVVP